MDFFRQYLFETILAAVAVLGIAGGVYYGMSASGAADERIEQRLALARDVQSLSRDGVSQEALEVRQAYIERLQQEDRRVRERFVELGKNTYDVIDYTRVDGGVEEMFPWDVEDANPLRPTRARDQLNAAFDALTDGMPVTNPPTMAEVSTEIERRITKYTIENARKIKKLRPTGEEEMPGRRSPTEGIQIGPARGPEGRPGEFPEYDMPFRDYGPPSRGYPTYPMETMGPGAGRETPEAEKAAKLGILTQQQIQQKAQRDALIRSALQASNAGLIYVDPDFHARVKNPLAPYGAGAGEEFRSRRMPEYEMPGMEEVPGAGGRVTVEQLWYDQVRLWVMKDVLRAIKATNENALEPGEEAVVANAAVKRLVWVDCSGRFYMGREGRDGVADRSFDEDYWEEGMMEVPPGAGGRRGGARRREPELPKAPTITQDVSNPQYDVVVYSVYVIVDPEWLGAFERNLMSERLHTVLGHEIRAVHEPLERDRAYYGVEPVKWVKIEGQLKLPAEWIRGEPPEGFRPPPKPRRPRRGEEPEPVQIDWVSEPLVPADVLDRPIYEPALRPVDQARLPQKPETADDERSGRRMGF